MDLNKKNLSGTGFTGLRETREVGNILFFFFFFLMDFTCVNVWTINLSFFYYSCGCSWARPSLLPLFRCMCEWNGSHADPWWSPSASTQNFKRKQWKTERTQHTQKQSVLLMIRNNCAGKRFQFQQRDNVHLLLHRKRTHYDHWFPLKNFMILQIFF